MGRGRRPQAGSHGVSRSGAAFPGRRAGYRDALMDALQVAPGPLQVVVNGQSAVETPSFHPHPTASSTRRALTHTRHTPPPPLPLPPCSCCCPWWGQGPQPSSWFGW